MALVQIAEDEVQLALLATSGEAGVAVDLLVNRLALERDHAEAVLARGHGLLATRLNRRRAERALPLLAAFGLRATIQPCDAPPAAQDCDVSVRPAGVKAARKALSTVKRQIDAAVLTLADFAGPSGLVLRKVPPVQADLLCRALRRLPGVSATLSQAISARLDLFADKDLDDTRAGALDRELRLLGHAPGGFGDALACGLEPRVLDRLLAKFPDFGLFGVDQAFQRHELLVLGRGSLGAQEFIDFLLTRPMIRRNPPRDILRALPLRLESNLTRTAAVQFLADYAAIGLRTVTRLQRCSRESWESP